VKAAALDTTLKAAFDAAIAAHPEIKIVDDSGQSFYTTSEGLKAAQNILTAHPDVSVIVSADQAITGAVQALKDSPLKDKVKLVGYGGGTIALQDIAAGTRYGTVMQMPATEGRVGTENLIKAIRTGTPVPGVDPLDSLPEGGVVTKENVQTFLPLAEWPG
jgi:ribose transport system substrate-binding protein